MLRSLGVLLLFLLGSLTAVAAFGVDVLGLSTNVAAAVSASAEIFEDIESVGHGHGMLLLTASKLCRELNVLREAAADEFENNLERSKRRSTKSLLQRPFSVLVAIFTNHLLVWTLAVGALAAAWVEVVQDSKPGGHHGAVLLALNELLELRQEARRPIVFKFLHRTAFRLFLVSGAAAVALVETLLAAENKVGAHHGVLILGICKSMRCIGLIRKDRRELQEKKHE